QARRPQECTLRRAERDSKRNRCSAPSAPATLSLLGNTWRRRRQKTLALQLLARELAGAAHGFGGFASPFLRGLLVVPTQFHLAENSLALHLLLEGLQGLVDIVVANKNLHALRPMSGIGFATCPPPQPIEA